LNLKTKFKIFVTIIFTFVFILGESDTQAQKPAADESKLTGGSHPDILFAKANQSYLNDRFSEAADYYEQILKAGFESPSVYYNLGNAYFRIGQIGRAILNYERALKLDPDDDDIFYNIKFAQTQTADKVESLPGLFIFGWWDNLLSLFPLTIWIVLFFIFYYLFVACAGFYLIPQNLLSPKFSYVAGIIVLLISILMLLISSAKAQKHSSDDYGIIISQSVSVKSSPDENSPDSFLVHEGLKVKIEDSFKNWLRIKLADGNDGWLPKKSVVVI